MEHEYPPYQVTDDVRRGSSLSTITAAHIESEMHDGSLTPSEDGGRSAANYGYVGVTRICTITLRLAMQLQMW